jgi:hypothetical protein
MVNLVGSILVWLGPSKETGRPAGRTVFESCEHLGEDRIYQQAGPRLEDGSTFSRRRSRICQVRFQSYVAKLLSIRRALERYCRLKRNERGKCVPYEARMAAGVMGDEQQDRLRTVASSSYCDFLTQKKELCLAIFASPQSFAPLAHSANVGVYQTSSRYLGSLRASI